MEECNLFTKFNDSLWENPFTTTSLQLFMFIFNDNESELNKGFSLCILFQQNNKIHTYVHI